jgi:presenilin-like A22 family membrane protease
MADEERDVRIEHPNRKKASSKVTRLIVVVLLLASAGLLAIITWGGWDTLEGAKPLQIAYILLYVLMAFLVLRWSRGILPVASALAIIMLIFSAVSAPQWFDRDKAGFTNPALDVSIIGLLTALMVPLQILLIAFAMSGFRQAWNVEVEHGPDDEPDRGRDEDDERQERAERGDASPAPA